MLRDGRKVQSCWAVVNAIGMPVPIVWNLRVVIDWSVQAIMKLKKKKHQMMGFIVQFVEAILRQRYKCTWEMFLTNIFQSPLLM